MNVGWMMRLAGLLLGLDADEWAVGQVTTRVSVASNGAEGAAASGSPAVSHDGRFIAFVSLASNLAPGGLPGHLSLFLHDNSNGQTRRIADLGSYSDGTFLGVGVSISADGRFVGFGSQLFDRVSGATLEVGISSAGLTRGGTAASVSGDGRYVAFLSGAEDMVEHDTNGVTDVFVRDRLLSVTSRVSVGSLGEQGDARSWEPCISADGRFVSFMSDATTLVPEDTNGERDVFVHDRESGVTRRVSVSSEGGQADAGCGGEFWRRTTISADGRYVAFESRASNLVLDDTNAMSDVFVHDLISGSTTRISVSSAGFQSTSDSGEPSISADGRFIAFRGASELVPLPPMPPKNGSGTDILLHDRASVETSRMSIDSFGALANWRSLAPCISGNARFVAFGSGAYNLVPNDHNLCDDVFVHVRATCSGDVNFDGAVDFLDLNLVLATYTLCGPNAVGDANGDGCVTFLDLNIVLGGFGMLCP